MPLPIISNVYRVTLNWTHTSGQIAANVLHIQASASTAQGIASAVDSAALQNMWAQVSQNAVMTKLQVVKLDGSSGQYELATSGAKWTGAGGAGDYIPAFSELVSLKTGLRGPANRGRLFLPFITEAAQSNGTITGVSTTQTAWNSFFSSLTAGGNLLVVASYKHGVATVVTSLVVESLGATQRRRQTRLR